MAEKPKKKIKPCRICTDFDPFGEPQPHDPGRLHADTSDTDPRKGAR